MRRLGPQRGPGVETQVLDDADGGGWFVECVEVNTGDACVEQFLALLRGILDSELGGTGVVVFEGFEAGEHLGWDFGSAEGCEFLDLGGVEHGDDTWE